MSSFWFVDWLNTGAQSLRVLTLVVPNPEWRPSSDNGQAVQINESISFHFLTSFDIRTLSSRGANSGNDVTGLLYVPTLVDSDPCVNASAPYVPQNVTRRAQLPPDDYNLIALVPWVSGTCALHYVEAARKDPVHSVVFYVPDNGTGIPPDVHDKQWDIPNAGNWRDEAGFPIYAINGQKGALLMNASSLYSGNMTDVPFGHELTEFYDSRDYVRLFVDIDTGNGTSLPSLWIFLLIVLGILLAIIGLTSFAMHCLQRRRRQNLRRRVERGEIDLEALGIKRLTVPLDVLTAMPLYTYGTTTDGAVSSGTDADTDLEKIPSATQTEHVQSAANPPLKRKTSYHPTALEQPTCAICLEDFVPATREEEGTMVRELPCLHIFHPECVDTFLRDSSSLCPMCKKSALPTGYCPRVVTNAMVRRERIIRRMRDRLTDDPDAADGIFPPGFQQRIRTLPPSNMSDVPLAPATADGRPQTQPPATPAHQSWARQRAEAMLGRRAPDDPDAEEARATPAWRKALRGLFPRH
ncbi:hypothetical protein CERZMDRAFT_112464 [Cercospora zeae-maydis SCOH1-5]|uniref:RING-type domain-containing protein n=1 Tax=Cercospora zeae-maydis SCOH1-5 TaxID=717836 RepID=A0A6A6FE54_9PEZI|nr:hypothetical protein CERZMDRAFT_112464 [Cercospora zeae-maydis SCOH1-5]